MRILITGVAGSGKSTIVAELRKNGNIVLDLDNCGAGVWVNKQTGARAEYREGAGRDWIESHRWQADAPKLLELMDVFGADKDIFVGGKVSTGQLKEMSEIFDMVYLLIPDDAVIGERLRTRTTNAVNFAKNEDERKAIFMGGRRFEEACLAIGAIPLKNHGTIGEIVEQILKKNLV